MAITPAEIDNLCFSPSKKGYDTDEVDAFLERCSSEVDAMLQKIADLKGRLTASEQQLAAAQAQIAQLQSQPTPKPPTTGASNDIEKATSIARAMVTQYGMSDKFGMVALGQQRNRYLGGGAELTCSEGTAQQIDAEVQRLVEEGHQQAVDTLKAHRFKLHEIAHYLQKKETITGDEFMNMLTRDDGFAPTLPKTQ